MVALVAADLEAEAETNRRSEAITVTIRPIAVTIWTIAVAIRAVVAVRPIIVRPRTIVLWPVVGTVIRPVITLAIISVTPIVAAARADIRRLGIGQTRVMRHRRRRLCGTRRRK